MATLFDENRFEAEIDAKVKTIVKNELPKESVHRATVLRKDVSGTWWVRLDSGEETPVLVNKVDMSVGDVVTVTLRDHVTYADGNITSPPMSASNTEQYVGDVVAHSVKALTADIGFLKADVATIGYAQIEDADITNARIQNLVYEVTQNITHLNAVDANILELQTNSLTANSAVITNLQTETAKIEDLTAEQLEATVGYIEDLTAGSIQAADIIADHAEVSNLDTNYAHITDGVIDNAKIDYADVEDLDANYAHISNGVIDNATIGYADVEDLDTHYAQIDLANIANGTITSAMIGNAQITTALIADEAVGDSKIATVSANKLTAGTIDASKINVANLNAKNLIVEKINGQPVLGGLELVPSGSTGYSSKNPSVEGWYEMVNGSFVLSQDTEVDDSKAYYRSGTATRLYDQDYIDALETSLGDRIDGAIETFTSEAIPTLSNYPAADWTSGDYADHVGDVCYVVNPDSEADGYCYRFAYDSTEDSYGWVLIKDSDVTAALQRLLDAEGDISGLQSFQSDTQTWITNTDTELGSLQTAQTSLETRLSTAEGTLQTKVDTQTFNSVSNTVDSHTQTIQSMSTTVQTASTNASNALSTANTAVQTALDGAFLVLTSTNGQLFKNGTESTILQVAVFPNGGDRCDTLAQVRSRFGPAAYIEWKWKHDTDNQWGTLVSTDSHISHDGMWLTVTPADVAAKTSFSASLIVPGEED